MAKKTKLYELIMVIKPVLSEADRKKVVASVRDAAKELKPVKEEEWGQKPLAYPIDRQSAGYYYYTQLEGENVIPADFEQKLLRNTNVLRHILLRSR